MINHLSRHAILKPCVQVIVVAATKADNPTRKVSEREGRDWASQQVSERDATVKSLARAHNRHAFVTQHTLCMCLRQAMVDGMQKNKVPCELAGQCSYRLYHAHLP